MPIAKLKVLLAIGTEEQIHYLMVSRRLPYGFNEQEILQKRIAIPSMPNPLQLNSPSISNAETQTNFGTIEQDDKQNKVEVETKTSFIENDQTSNVRQSALSDMLNNFIDNLASRLPDRVGGQNSNEATTSSYGGGSLPIRRTSDLLDTLQRALMCPPPAVQSLLQQQSGVQINNTEEINSGEFQPKSLEHLVSGLAISSVQPIEESTEPHFQVLIEIENALHISKIFIRVNKKCGKQRGRCKTQTYRGVHEVEPSTYVTFEANGPPTSIVNSPEGPVYTTNVAEKTSSPQWNKRFEVSLPVDLMTNVSSSTFVFIFIIFLRIEKLENPN